MGGIGIPIPPIIIAYHAYSAHHAYIAHHAYQGH